MSRYVEVLQATIGARSARRLRRFEEHEARSALLNRRTRYRGSHRGMMLDRMIMAGE
jgi:hypothetical protein